MDVQNDIHLLSKDDLILMVQELQESNHLNKRALELVFKSQIEDILHAHKNELFSLLNKLKQARNSSPGRTSMIIDEQIVWIGNRIHEITKAFVQASDVSINVNQVISEVLKIFTLEQGKTRIQFHLELHPHLPSIIGIDGEFKIVLFNLISNAVNAIKEANRKRGKISISTNVVEEMSMEFLQITVQDSGIGIAKEHMELIYQKSFSTHNVGAGMGLFITKSIVNKYGGKIKFKSKLGQGSHFRVLIPLRRNS